MHLELAEFVSLDMCSRSGQTPNANRFCHQDTKGLDTDQLLPPKDRLPERRWALSKIDGRCQKVISPRPRRRPSEERKSQAAMPPVAEGGQPARQGARRTARQPTPGPAAFQVPGGEEGAISRERSPQACAQEVGGRAEGQQGGQKLLLAPFIHSVQHKHPKCAGWLAGWLTGWP